MTKQEIKNQNAHYWLQWEVALTKVYMDILRKNETFTLDSFFEGAKELDAPPQCLKRAASSLTKSSLANGYISKTGQYKLSSRKGSRPVVVYKSNKYQGK